jgi:hypothetical protein
MDALAPLRGLGIKFWLSFHFSTPPIFELRQIGLWAAGIELPRNNTHLNSAAIFSLEEKIARWKTAAARASLKCIIEGVDHPRLLQKACAAGADFVLSDQRWPATDQDATTLRDAG